MVIAMAGTGLIVTRLLAQGRLPAEGGPALDWFSLAGVIALAGVAVKWGAAREQARHHTREIAQLRVDVAKRFDRIERQIDSIFEAVGVERRHMNRHRYGERVDPEAGDGS